MNPPEREYWPVECPGAGALAAEVGVGIEVLARVPEKILPAGADDLLPFVQRLRGWRSGLKGKKVAVWIQPVAQGSWLSVDEAEQLLGTIGGVRLRRKQTLANGEACLVLGAFLRRRILGLCLRWPLDELLRIGAHARISPSWWLRRALHFVELPRHEACSPAWEAGIRALLRTIPRRGAQLPLGVYLEGIDDDGRRFSRAFARLREVARDVNPAVRIACQWIGKIDPLRDAMTVLGFAERNGLRFDFSLADGTDRSAAPYEPREAYVPFDFDLRVPCPAPGIKGVIEVPRTQLGPAVGRRASREWLNSLFDGYGTRLLEELERSLNPSERAAYLSRLERDRGLLAEWPRYHVYNWSRPLSRIMRVVSLEAGAALESRIWHGPLPIHPALALLRKDDIFLCRPFEFLQEATECALEQGRFTSSELLEDQIEAHDYLVEGRREPSADSRSVLDALPERLGKVLDLGCGYGLWAERIGPRCEAYVGMDLLVSQASATARFGGMGIVGDIHRLPFHPGLFEAIIADNILEHAYDPVGVLIELRKLMSSGGRIYAVIPLDANSNEYQIRTHLWKASEASVREAFRRAGYEIRTFRPLDQTALGMYGSFPASNGQSVLVVAD